MTVSAFTLFSSSAGNCTYVTDGETRFLIDAGYSEKRIKAALAEAGSSLDDISAIFVTHEHSDHTHALPVLCRHRELPVHAVKQTARCLNINCAVPHKELYSERLGGFTVNSFRTSHDSRGSCGYVIEHDSGVKIGTLTDTGFVSDEMLTALDGCYAVILEANYDEDMLLNGPYPPDLQYRIMSKRGHLSNSQCAEILPALYGGGTRRVLLAHLSKENNTPETARARALAELEREGIRDMSVGCADRLEIKRLI